MVALVLGFLIFHILEKSIMIHHAHEGDYAEHKHPQVGVLSAIALAGHSFMDGVGIGLGFQVNPAVGMLVAIAVISHDFTDGMNTVSLMLSHHNSDKKSKLFLLLDAFTPILGALSTLLFHVSSHFLILYLGFFAGLSFIHRRQRYFAGSPQQAKLVKINRADRLGCAFDIFNYQGCLT